MHTQRNAENLGRVYTQNLGFFSVTVSCDFPPSFSPESLVTLGLSPASADQREGGLPVQDLATPCKAVAAPRVS